MVRSREVERRRLERLAQLRQRIDSEPDPDRRRARAVDLLAPGAGRFELSVALEALVAHVEEPAFIDALLDLVEDVPADLLDADTDALGVCRSPRRDPVLSRVSARAREADARRREGGME